MTELAAALLGALVGAAATYWATVRLARKADRWARTDEMVDDFFSTAFLDHRIAVWDLWNRVKSGQVSVEDLAGGFWFPGNFPAGYQPAPSRGGLNDHEHLEAYIGYIVRLARTLEHSRLELSSVQDDLGMALKWHDPLLQRVAEATERQARADSRPVPKWTDSAKLVREHLVIPAVGT